MPAIWVSRTSTGRPAFCSRWSVLATLGDPTRGYWEGKAAARKPAAQESLAYVFRCLARLPSFRHLAFGMGASLKQRSVAASLRATPRSFPLDWLTRRFPTFRDCAGSI